MPRQDSGATVPLAFPTGERAGIELDPGFKQGGQFGGDLPAFEVEERAGQVGQWVTDKSHLPEHKNKALASLFATKSDVMFAAHGIPRFGTDEIAAFLTEELALALKLVSA